MSCKYKKYDGTDGIHPWCWVTGGECQFLNSPYDHQCEILNAYPKKPLENENISFGSTQDNENLNDKPKKKGLFSRFFR